MATRKSEQDIICVTDLILKCSMLDAQPRKPKSVFLRDIAFRSTLSEIPKAEHVQCIAAGSQGVIFTSIEGHL